MTWDKSKENKKQKKRPDGSGSSKLRESFKRSKPSKPRKNSGQSALRKRKKK